MVLEGSQVGAKIFFESRVTSDAANLGPCRRLRAVLFEGNRHRGESELGTVDSFLFDDDVTGGGSTGHSIELESMEPQLAGNGEYCLDFQSSVPIVASVKNFILRKPDGSTIVKMYKVRRGEFMIEVTSGISLLPIQVFAIAISSIDRKICTQ